MRYDASTNTVRFDRMLEFFPSGGTMFSVRKAPGVNRWFTVSNMVTSENVRLGPLGLSARNYLVLATSVDGLFNWTVCGELLADDTGLSAPDSASYTGFHNVDWFFDGADLVLIIRTSYRGANSYHNTNRVTVKRVPAYDTLCRAPTQIYQPFEPATTPHGPLGDANHPTIGEPLVNACG